MLITLAPCKINLMLHVIGREVSGYHALQSLFAFTGLADKLTFTPSEQDKVEIAGPFALSVLSEHNSVLSAIHWFYDLFPSLKRSWHVALEKNIPVAAGLGGGTSDAAAAIATLVRFHNVTIEDIPAFVCAAGALGADVPVCLAYQMGLGSLFWLHGSGKAQYPEPVMGAAPYPIIFVNPLKPTYTKDVFHQFGGTYSELIQPFDGQGDVVSWASSQRNDVEKAACELVPEIHEVLDVLHHLPGCRLARMSGTGATCFAIFDSHQEMRPLKEIQKTHPHWWIYQTVLLAN